jgi:hypothetical protein
VTSYPVGLRKDVEDVDTFGGRRARRHIWHRRRERPSRCTQYSLELRAGVETRMMGRRPIACGAGQIQHRVEVAEKQPTPG